MLRAAHFGRQGLNCTLLYAACGAAEWRFVDVASDFAFSPVADEAAVARLVKWAVFKERFATPENNVV